MAGIEQDRLSSAEPAPGDKAFDRAIRPKMLADYHGQPSVSRQMNILSRPHGVVKKRWTIS